MLSRVSLVFQTYFSDDFAFLVVFVGFRVGFGAGFGVASITGCAVACTGVSVGICVLVLVVGIGSDSKSHNPVMKIIEPGIAKTA